MIIARISKNINNYGFSLIELSIVLIIMGLLGVGVTSGVSLIQSAKIRSTINEYYEYKTAYNAYYERYGKVPNENPNDPGIIYEFMGFVDLYDKGFINKEPTVIPNKPYWYYLPSKISSRVIWFLRGGGYNNLHLGLAVSISDKESSYRLTYVEATGIENKIDDGSASTGKVLAWSSDNGSDAFGSPKGGRNTELFIELDF